MGGGITNRAPFGSPVWVDFGPVLWHAPGIVGVLVPVSLVDPPLTVQARTSDLGGQLDRVRRRDLSSAGRQVGV